MKWNMVKAVMSVTLAVSVWLCSLPETALAHGTTSQTITKDMLVTMPDKDYQVNMEMQRDASEGAYNTFFLDNALQTVSIDIDEINLNYLLQRAKDKPTVMTNSVTIGGEKIRYAGLKTKGNYTLEHSYDDDDANDRFSFTINFGKYIKKKDYGVKQNFYGCSKISFNNFYFDRSMMKEFFAMKLMSEMGLPTPQYGLAKLYINGQYYGVYFMVEAMDSTIIEQYQKASPEEISSYLTKPINTDLRYDSSLDSLLTADGAFDLSSVLTVDEKGNYAAKGVLESQKGLWEEDSDTLQDVADMLPTVFSWEKKLNQLSEGKNFSNQKIDVNSDEYVKLLNTIMDVDEAIRYFAVHSFLVQLDDMFVNQQNYGLYVDKNGKSTLLPWDYDLCFGCYYPGTTELTANFFVEDMYWEGVGTEAELGRPFEYSNYPIFNVIYQNKELMEKFYSYLKDCSKIVLLGGRVFTGKSYRPAYFTSYIDEMQDELKKAASEKMAANAHYHMRANQPSDMLRALPNLSKIMAQRSMGVYNQVMGVPFFVAGNECDLSTLGNAMPSWYSNFGYLMLVDDKTGISVSSYYGEMEDENKKAPLLSVTELGQADKNYQAAKQAVGCENDANLTVYQLKVSGEPRTKYTVIVPLEHTYATDEIAVYSYTEDKTTKLNLVMEENICTGKTASVKYIAVLKTAGEADLKEVELEDDSVDLLPAVPENPQEQKPQKKIALNKTSVTLRKGKTYQLKLKNATKKVTWKSSNKKVAVVGKKGKVTAKKKGTATIKAICEKKTYRCKVKVK